MQGVHLRKYGVEAIINFELYEVDGVDLRTDAADAGADCNIMKDEGAEATCTNDFVDEGMGYSITLTATEMQAARIVLYIIDSATKVWLDKVIVIETYGHASAQHALDLDDAVRGGMTALPNAVANAAGGLPISDAGELDLDAMNTNINDIETDTGEIGSAVGASISADIAAVKAETALIVADTNELQTDDVPTKIVAVQTEVDKIDTVDTVVDAIKVVTDNLAASATTLITGIVSWENTEATTTVFYSDDITEATADHYNGRIIIFTSGALLGQATDITDYALDTGEGKFTVTALTEAPADNDTFVIV